MLTLLGLFEGDILIDKDTERYLTGGEIISRDAVVSPVLYWPKGIVYYKFDEALGVLLVVEMIYIVIPHTVSYRSPICGDSSCSTYRRNRDKNM